MINGKKAIVVLPAYNAEKTLERTVAEIDRTWVDEIILVDDKSSDRTAELAKKLKLTVFRHEKNLGYGGNQKTCYRAALDKGADYVIMLHPDYQYSPKLLNAMLSMLASGHYDVVLGSRILGGGALQGGMPVYKYIANRALTFAQNVFTGMKLSEYHTGYRGYRRQVLEAVPFAKNSDDFVFDNQILLQVHFVGFHIGEISCPTLYFEEASSINFKRSVRYGLLCLWNTVLFALTKIGLYDWSLMPKKRLSESP